MTKNYLLISIRSITRTRKYLLLLTLIGILVSCEIDQDLVDPLITDLFVVYDQSKGMGGNQVRAIYNDSNKDLWFACYGEGITRYNGDSFVYYNSGNSGLENHRVLCITEDGDGDMWFGTTDGIYFLVDNSEWYYYALLDNTDVRVNALFTDKDNIVWIGTEGNGLFYYDQGIFYGPYTFREFPELNVINDFSLDKSGDLWMATDLASLHYNGEFWDIYPSNSEYPPNTALHLDPKGKLWIGSNGGIAISYYYGTSFTNLSPFNGQPNIFINGISSDLSGNLWFATFLDGIIMYDGAVMHSYKPFNGFPSVDNYCVEADSYGNVWIGTLEHGAIQYIPPVHY